ncbi:MAG: SH3 domain-containing protein [Bacillus sp. (in: firmicutes)]
MKKVVVPGVFLAALAAPVLVHEVHADSINGKEIKKYVDVDKNSNLNVRKIPSTSAEVVAKLKKDDGVLVASETNGWAKISINGKTGYVASKYLTATTANTQQATTNNSKAAENPTVKYVNVDKGSSLNLRIKPSGNSSIIVKLAKGVSVTFYSETNGWAKVKVYGKEGYVSSKYLTESKTATTDSTTTVNKSSNNQIKSVIKYVNVANKSTLNMRSSASTKGSIVTTLSRGTKAEVLSEKNGWTKIKANNKTGYVSSQYLSANNPVKGTDNSKEEVNSTKLMYVNINKTSTLNLRSTGTTSGKILAKLTRGTQVEVYSQANGWSKIKVNGKTGYVSSEFLAATKISDDLSDEGNQNSSDEKQEENKTKYVNVSGNSSLNVRKSASTSAAVLTKLANNKEVIVLSEKDGWTKIKVENITGYVSTSYLTDKKNTANSTEEPNQNNSDEPNNDNSSDEVTKYVNVNKGSNLNMREQPTTTGKIISKLESGTIVTVLSEKDGWANISVNGKTGYVSSEFLAFKTGEESGTSNGTVHTTYQNYDISLDQMTTIQMEATPQTDKKYNVYIREDALVFKTADATKGSVLGNGWRLRGGAGTEYWVTNKVNSGDQLTVVAKVKGSDGYYWYEVKGTSTWVAASKDDTSYYINPQNFVSNKVTTMQFLKLSETTNINDGEVNEKILAGKGILSGKASAFVTAANAYGVNEIYLISHALLETGNGTSTLASGVSYNGKTVYNMYGIGAYDGSAVTSGAKYAYNAGWFTPEAAIIGGAKFIAQGYINAGQDTLYKMRWNPYAATAEGVATHQYASDIGWATKQVNQIYNLYNLLNSYTLKIEVPVYK